jgi:HIT domain
MTRSRKGRFYHRIIQTDPLPGITLSCILVAITCGFAALRYAELASTRRYRHTEAQPWPQLRMDEERACNCDWGCLSGGRWAYLGSPTEACDKHLVAEVRQRLLTGLKPDGFNVGFNDGLAAGQTVEHAHVHIIPRVKSGSLSCAGAIHQISMAEADSSQRKSWLPDMDSNLHSRLGESAVRCCPMLLMA